MECNHYDYYMGDEYYYRKINDFGIEIRHFIFNLDGDIEKQMHFVMEHDINGLALSPNNNDVASQYKLACSIIEKLNDKLLLLIFLFDEFETLDILDSTPNLKSLSLHCKLKKPYDFTKLSNLEDLTVWYGKAFSSVFECTGIKQLQIFKMDAYAAENIHKLYQLRDLQIRQSSIKDIDGLRNLSKIERLSLRYLPKLESISFIENCRKIKWLLLQNCKKVADWEVISTLSDLKELCLESCGTLNDIDFLKPLENLVAVSLIVDTKLTNGNVRWLYERPTMKKIVLPWRKDFNISLEEFWAGQTPERYPDVWKWNL